MNFKEYLTEAKNKSEITKLFKSLNDLSYDPYDRDDEELDNPGSYDETDKDIESILLKLSKLDDKAFENAKDFIDSWGEPGSGIGLIKYSDPLKMKQTVRVSKDGKANKTDIKVQKKRIKDSINKLKEKRNK